MAHQKGHQTRPQHLTFLNDTSHDLIIDQKRQTHNVSRLRGGFGLHTYKKGNKENQTILYIFNFIKNISRNV